MVGWLAGWRPDLHSSEPASMELLCISTVGLTKYPYTHSRPLPSLRWITPAALGAVKWQCFIKLGPESALIRGRTL